MCYHKIKLDIFFKGVFMFDSKYVFCPKCGMRLKENASFCTICGTKIYQENGIATSVNEKINIRVKPTFKLGYFLSLNLFNCFILYLLFVGFSGFINFRDYYLIIALIFLIIALLATLIGSIILKKQYNNSTYDFYDTKVIYCDSFLNLTRKEVKYKYIREVIVRQNLLQSFFNLGTIVLLTSASSYYRNGIYIPNVANPQYVYNKIQGISDIDI